MANEENYYRVKNLDIRVNVLVRLPNPGNKKSIL